MLTIRKAQMDAFAAAPMEAFRVDLVKHVEQEFPDEFAALGEQAVVDVIDYGIDLAGAYGINSLDCVALFVNFLFVYGPDFDRDPELPWVPITLNDQTLSQEDAMDALYERALSETREVGIVYGQVIAPTLLQESQKRT